MLNRPAIVRLFASICLIMAIACPGWAGNITPVIGNSIMGGTDIRIIADGSDEKEAVEGLVALVKSGFTD